MAVVVVEDLVVEGRGADIHDEARGAVEVERALVDKREAGDVVRGRGDAARERQPGAEVYRHVLVGVILPAAVGIHHQAGEGVRAGEVDGARGVGRDDVARVDDAAEALGEVGRREGESARREVGAGAEGVGAGVGARTPAVEDRAAGVAIGGGGEEDRAAVVGGQDQADGGGAVVDDARVERQGIFMAMDIERGRAADGRQERGEPAAAREEADERVGAIGLHERTGGEAQDVGAVAEEEVAARGDEGVHRQTALGHGDGGGELEVLGGGGRRGGRERGGGDVVVTGVTGLVQRGQAETRQVGGQVVAADADPARDDVVDGDAGRVVFPGRDEDLTGIEDTGATLDIQDAVAVRTEIGQHQLVAEGASRVGSVDVEVGATGGDGDHPEVLLGVAPVATDEVEAGAAHGDRRGVGDTVGEVSAAAAAAAVLAVVQLQRAVAELDRGGTGELGVARQLQDAAVDQGRAGVGVVGPEGQGADRPGRGVRRATEGQGHRTGDAPGEVAAIGGVDDEGGVAAGRGDDRGGVGRLVVLEDGAGHLDRAVQVERAARHREVAVALVVAPERVVAGAELHRALVDGVLAVGQDGLVQQDRTGARLDEARVGTTPRAGDDRVHRQRAARGDVEQDVGGGAGGDQAVVDDGVGGREDAATEAGGPADSEDGVRGEEEGRAAVQLEGVDLEGGAKVGGRRGQADVLVLEERAQELVGLQGADVGRGRGVGGEGDGVARGAVTDEGEGQDELVVGAVRTRADTDEPAGAADGADVRGRARAGAAHAGATEEDGGAVGGTAAHGAEDDGSADGGGRNHRDDIGAAHRDIDGAEGLGAGGGRGGGVEDEFATLQVQRASRPHEVRGIGALDHGELAARTEGDGAGVAEGDPVDKGIARADIHRAGHQRAGHVEVDRAGAVLGEAAGAGDGRRAEVDDAGAARVGHPGEVGASGHAAVEVEGGAGLGADDRPGRADGEGAADRRGAAGQTEEGAAVVDAARVDRDTFG